MNAWGVAIVALASLSSLASGLLVLLGRGRVRRRLGDLEIMLAETLSEARSARLASTAAHTELEALVAAANRLRSKRGPQGSNPEITGSWKAFDPGQGAE